MIERSDWIWHSICHALGLIAQRLCLIIVCYTVTKRFHKFLFDQLAACQIHLWHCDGGQQEIVFQKAAQDGTCLPAL